MRTDSHSKEIEYIQKLFAREDEHLQCVRREAERFGKLGMQIGPYEGSLLRFLCHSVEARKVVEFGAFVGYSTTWLARSLPDDGKVFSLEKNEDYAARASALTEAAGLGDRVQFLVGEARESMRRLEGEAPFDLVFIDANKSAYVEYLEWAEEHLRSGGLIVGDNTFLFGHVLEENLPEKVARSQWEAMREFNRRLAESEKFVATLLATEQGMTVALKK